ncbi:MAG: ABC-type transport auxiliary lipoprotein family protein [Legionellales bacterium]|jgi:cholesterol transport system auxiliary component
MKNIYLLLAVLLLSGCSSLLTSKQNVDQFYTVNALKDYDGEKQNVDATITIQSPTVSKGLDGNRIMLMHSPQRLDYFAKARWSSPLSMMVQTSLVESFENSEALDRVATDYSGLRPNYVLLLEIQDFQAEYKEANQPPVIHIKLVAKLVDFPLRNLMASFSVETFKQAEENELDAIMFAFDQAFAGAQELMIEETLDYFEQ